MFRQLKKWGSSVVRRFTDLGAAIVSPFERLVGGAAGKVLAATEQVDRFESLFLRFFRVLFSPLRMVGRVLQAILPESLTRLFASGGGLVSRAGMGLLQLAEKLNLDRAVMGLVWLLQPVWRPLAAIGVFGYCWLETREYRRGLMALPAIFLVTLVLGVGVWHSVFGKSRITANYKTAVREMLESRDYDSAKLYEKKLAQLGFNTQLTEYRTALAFAEEDQLDEAYQRMQLLAPVDQPGYPTAHFWIIQQLMSGQLDVSEAEARRLAKVHLDHLETLEITSPYKQLLLALWLIQGDQLAEAATVLEPLVSVMPNAAFERMRIDLLLKRPDQARLDARALVTQMSALTRRGTELSPTDYQWWLAAEELLGNWQQMRTILDQWRELEPENTQARNALAVVCRRQAAQLLRSPLPKEQQIVELWLDAAELDQSNESLLQLARFLYRDREQTPIYQRVLDALRQSPRTPASLLVAMGTEAAKNQSYDDARQFLAAAASRDETDPVAWNNYAWVLGEGENPALDEALKAVNRALDLAPEEHRFRETRGQILLRLERWQEAVEDLEFAINGLPSLDAIHKSLATAYTALGQDELARLHELQAEGF
ncbi:MAG: hypothetical protein GXP24_06975 [Planctomycetes bacterium]|nr:hypothetical protein [Planctomycetota bacterium]